MIVTLGNFATRFILKTNRGITGLRGTVQKAGRFTVLPIFHPAAALYDNSKRDVLLDDFALLRELLDESDAAQKDESAQDGRRSPEDTPAQSSDRDSEHEPEQPSLFEA